jgi:hypothetical protein
MMSGIGVHLRSSAANPLPRQIDVNPECSRICLTAEDRMAADERR